ncbi:MAG: MarR family winged helix-turn-helix transcriptional regulator [Bilifractor sp.]
MKNSLHYRLRACHIVMNKNIVHEIQQATNLRPGEPKILEFLAEHQPCEQKAIADGCDIDSASVTGILGRMEERGLIERHTHPGNRRSLFVSMTEKGKESETLIEKIFYQIDCQAVSGLSTEEQTQLQTLLDRIYDNMKKSQHL